MSFRITTKINRNNEKEYTVEHKDKFFFLTWWCVLETFKKLDDALEYIVLSNLENTIIVKDFQKEIIDIKSNIDKNIKILKDKIKQE